MFVTVPRFVFSRVCPLALSAILILAVAGAALAHSVPAPQGPVVLTIAGDITHTNRDASHTKRDGFFAYHEIEFKSAFVLDRATLQKLPQKEIVCQPPQYDRTVTFSGPSLRDVLDLVGAEKVSLKTRALDGFAVELTAEQVASKDWILATHADGKPFGIGDKGPIWLMHTPSAKKVPEEEEQGWPWAVFYMEVKK